MSTSHFVIKARDGSVLHQGDAQTQRKFLSGLLAAKVSFRNADLRGWPLNHHVMDGRDFRDADLSGANMAGASACGADMTGAILRGLRADGLRAVNARMRNADLGPREDGDEDERTTRLRGADLSGADLSLSRIGSADFSGAVCHATRFTKARVTKTSFRGTVLVNAQFALSSFSGSDFTGADLSSDTGSPLMSMPDRTIQAVICDNTYGDSRLDEGAPAFGQDRRAGKMMRAASWGVSAIAIAGIANLLPEEAGSEMLRHVVGHWAEAGKGIIPAFVGNGLLLIAAVKLASFIREAVEHVSQEHVGKGVLKGLRAAKLYAREAASRGWEMGNLVAAAVSGPGFGTVRRALRLSAEKGSFLREVVTGDAQLILCDRGHLARALSRLHVERTRGLAPAKDLLLLRQRADADPTASPAPTALRLNADGGTRAVWRVGSRFMSASWDAEGNQVASEGFREPAPSMASAKAAFEHALWHDHGLKPLYLTNGHQIAAGRDDSIQVVHEGTGRLSNPWGPAFIGRDGTERHFRKGVEILVEAEASEPDAEPAFSR